MKSFMLGIDPESMMAQTISLHLTVKSVRAASAFTAGTDLVSAGVALRLRDTVQTLAGFFG